MHPCPFSLGFYFNTMLAGLILSFILPSLSSNYVQSGGEQKLYTVMRCDKMLWMSLDRLCPLQPSNQQPSAVITLFAFQLLYCQQHKHQSPSQHGRASH